MAKNASAKINFRGFISPRYTQVPDELFDDLMAHLSGAELKVLLYIIRRTFGFKKDTDNISLNQICNGIKTREGEILDKGTGLSLSTVQIAIKELVKKNCVLTVRNRSKDKGDEPTTYALNILPFTENQQGGIPKIGNPLYRKSVTQNTVLQETDLQIRNSSDNIKSENNRSNHNPKDQGFHKIGSILKQKVSKKLTTDSLPEPVKVTLDEISREFGERRNIRSNLTHSASLLERSGVSPEQFNAYLYEAKSITKQQGRVKKRMAYFFSVLEDLLDLRDKPLTFHNFKVEQLATK